MPILEHQIAALVEVGVSEVVLAVNYKPESMMEALKGMEEKYKVKLTCSLEVEPMGTAGPLALARQHLSDGEPFFVFNSDVTCVYPLKALLEFHKSHGKEGTILVTKVDEPSKYGVVVHDEKGRIQHFVEKPQTFVGNHINAGMYCFSPSILDRIPLKPTSIEKEIFPAMADENQLYAMVLPGYWMDIGQPKDYLTGMCLHLNSLRKRNPELLATNDSYPGATIKGDVMIHPSAKVGAGAVLGPNVVIGPNCNVADGARIVRSTLLAGTNASAHSYISSSIIGWSSTVGKWARVEHSVVAEDVQIGDETIINGAMILPHKGIKDNIYTPGQIIM